MMATLFQAMDAPQLAALSSARTALLMLMERLCALLSAVTKSCSPPKDAMTETTKAVMAALPLALLRRAGFARLLMKDSAFAKKSAETVSTSASTNVTMETPRMGTVAHPSAP